MNTVTAITRRRFSPADRIEMSNEVSG